MNRGRVAGIVYLLVFITGVMALAVPGPVGSAAGVLAGGLYLAVTVLFYGLFKPVSGSISAVAACVSLAGIGAGPLLKVNPLPIFGAYCLLIAYLIVSSTYVPRVLGVLMAVAGLGWLTFLSPRLATALSPYNFAPGVIGEGALTLWLLVAGVDSPKPDAVPSNGG